MEQTIETNTEADGVDIVTVDRVTITREELVEQVSGVASDMATLQTILADLQAKINKLPVVNE